jgi:hypothetical protein
MKLRPTGRIRNVMRTVQNRIGAKAIILTYHRVAENLSDPQLLAVSPDHFSQHLEILNKLTSPVHLVELIPRLKTRNRHDRPLSVVTLDDGYADNLHCSCRVSGAGNRPGGGIHKIY